jgi:endonuclease/exonuclease/phosphatase family metal-dependent hydrolase
VNRAIRLLLITSLAVAIGATSAEARSVDVSFMSRNLFIGGDYTSLVVAPPSTFRAEAGKFWRHIIASDPKARMKLVAAEVARARPDVLAVQEAALWRTGPQDGFAPNATHVAYDFLALLNHDLAARGAHYRLAVRQEDLDLEGPTDMGIDVRVANANAIFVRQGVKVRAAHARAYRTQLAFASPTLGPITVKRGYAEADLTVRGRNFRVVDTHLEAYSTSVRAQQAGELVGGPLRSKQPVFLIGDLNSAPNSKKPADRGAYNVLARAGFKPLRTARPNCCFNDDLKTGRWDHIVDWLLGKPKQKLVRSYLTGRTARTARSHEYASDHGGLVSVVRIR